MRAALGGVNLKEAMRVVAWQSSKYVEHMPPSVRNCSFLPSQDCGFAAVVHELLLLGRRRPPPRFRAHVLRLTDSL